MTSPAFQKYMPPARRSAWVALAATVAALTWQAAAVHFNYRGNWTALFCIGEKSSMPPDLQSGAWIFPDSKGYDGQYYRVVAHDPWMRQGLSRFVDSTPRFRRILLPAAAWLLAFGQPLWIDSAYILLVLVSLFIGTWFTAMWVAVQNRSEWWGLGFLLLPGVVITLNRMTVDITEYACLAAALYFWRRKSWIGCWIAGAAAFLTRDLGLIVIASLVGMCLLQRFWTRAAVFAASALPSLLWNFHVAQTIVGDDRIDFAIRSSHSALGVPCADNWNRTLPRYTSSAGLPAPAMDCHRYPMAGPHLDCRGYHGGLHGSRARGIGGDQAASLHAGIAVMRAVRYVVPDGNFARFLD